MTGGASSGGETGTGGASLAVCPPGHFANAEQVVIEGMAGQTIWSPSLSSDNQTLYFALAGENEEIWRATRSDRGLNFAAAERLSGVNDDSDNGSPFVSSDQLTLYFFSSRSGAMGDRDLYRATRANVELDFGGVSALATNSAQLDHLPWVSADSLTLLFVSRRTMGVARLWMSTRTNPSLSFGTPVELAELAGAGDDARAAMADNGLVIYFSSLRAGGLGGDDIWYAQRASTNEPFSNIQNLSTVNTSGFEMDVALSADAAEMFFVSFEGLGTVFYRALGDCE